MSPVDSECNGIHSLVSGEGEGGGEEKGGKEG